MNKTAVITGISGGIGKALGQEFINQGYKVIGLDVDDSAFEEIEKEFSDLVCIKLDLSNTPESKIIYERIESENEVEIFVNNAGIANAGLFTDYTFEQYRKLMAINLDAVVFATYFWQEKMKKRGGSIVNIASVAGHTASPSLTHYATSKHAVVGFTRSMQLESEIYDIPVNHILVSPGFVDTAIMDVGEHSLPDNLNFIKSSPEETAIKIVAGILEGKKEIVPNLNGKAMIEISRFVPKGLRFLAKKALKNKN